MKILYRFIIILFLVFSFYYTNKMIEFLKEKDPIMKSIRKNDTKYKIDAINALIVDDNIIPGIVGKEIDYKKSYNKMKQYGNYNETLITLKDVKPTISIDNNYEKYIISGNKEKRSIALVFKVYKDTNINSLLSILNKNKVKANFFIDGTYLEKNIILLKSMKNHEINILSYNNELDKSLFETSISYLENILEKDVKYCMGKEVLELCSKLKLHTIKPSIEIHKNLYKEVKNNIDNSMIISININNYNLKELSSTIDYIKGKGYKIVLLSDLLSE
ncbi:MAG: hypothetical protein IK137_02010 [Bacilli bacterium]|nr:hypothetical protein [Bacilli bacterium]